MTDGAENEVRGLKAGFPAAEPTFTSGDG